MLGGWRIVKTMGTKITKIQAKEGFCAESAAALVLLGTAHFGIPVSTTHVIAGSIMGVGAVEQAAKVRWITARKILYAWLLTIPATATFGAIAYLVLRPLVGK
jgi:PiT family inorganic phosphate transporter